MEHKEIVEILEKHAEYTGVAHEILDGVLFDTVADEIMELFEEFLFEDDGYGDGLIKNEDN